MKIRITLTLMSALTLSACKAPVPAVTDDTLVISSINGVTLTHQYLVHAPQTFTPVNETWRALYNASVMSSPDFGGKVIRYLENGKPFIVLGEVENHWLAIADLEAEPGQNAPKQQQLIGYVPFRAGVKSELYNTTLRSDRPRPHKPKKVCVDVGGQSKACRNNNTATWILE